MFFSWYIKNKQFKAGSGLSGQITPFLIIILVILLIAAISTINIGRVSIDKTCSANGADAGSLAAASAWAGAFNGLCQWNKSINEYYDENYSTYGELSRTAEDYANESLDWSIGASVETLVAISPGEATCGSVYVGGIIAAAADGLAAALLFEAYQATTAFNATVQYMKSLTEIFHEGQWKNYCDARTYMDESYINARKVGLSYAFSNSCIPAKLSDKTSGGIPSQVDMFSAWLAGDGDWGTAGAVPSQITGTYPWVDSVNQQHTVSVDLDLPNIGTYELQHTEGSYSTIIAALDDMLDQSEIIATMQYSTATLLGAAAIIFIVAFVLSIVYIIVNAILFVGPAIAAAICVVLEFMSAYAIVQNELLQAIIAALVNISAIVITVLIALLGDNGMGYWGPDGIQSSSSCADAEDLMIVKISAFTLTSPRGNIWTALCCVHQLHPSTNTGIVPTTYPVVSSCGESKFSGGDVGTFINTYDPSIVDAN